MMAGAIFSTECSASVKYSMQSSLKWYWSIKWHWIIALISVTIRNDISLESIDIREFNFHTHFLRILYKKYFEAVNTQWFINLFAMFIIIRYIIKKESTENDGDDQNGGSLPSTRIGYETLLEWFILTIMKFQIVCPINWNKYFKSMTRWIICFST